MNQTIPYTRLSRRFRALFVDGVVLGLGFLVTIYFVKMFGVQPPLLEAIIIFSIVGSIEPLFVSVTGSSLGHHAVGLRVRRASEDKRLNVLLSYARFVAKIPLGLLSLLTVLTTRKHQAIHDLIGNSIVVHKSPELVPAHDVIPQRIENTGLYIYPSKLRRCIVILFYVSLASILLGTSSVLFQSDACLEGGACTSADSIVELILSLAFWVSVFTLVWLGWQGLLYGGRRRVNPNE